MADKTISLADCLHKGSEDGPNGCRLWKKCRDGWGYGRQVWGKKEYKAHRLAWALANGPIPSGMLVCHRCDTPACINPDHLFLGTGLDNTRDMHAKGRGHKARGEGSGMSKLTDDQVRLIRTMPGKHRDIATLFNVTHPLVGQIKRGKIWRHLL